MNNVWPLSTTLGPLLTLSAIGVGISKHMDRPIIGVLTVPLSSSECATYRDMTNYSDAGASCFDSVYVKWIESAGGRVVPLMYNAAPAELDVIFDSLNGVLFTGGELNISDLNSPYMQTAARLLTKAMTANRAGDYMPVWGTCLGFQTLSLLVAEDPSVLLKNTYDSESLMLPLNLASPGMVNESRMLQSFSADVLRWLTSENITVNFHHDGVPPREFMANPRLASFFRVISTNKDRHQVPFVSTIEGRNIPFYGVQWHPERPQFQFNSPFADEKDVITHSEHAIQAMQATANFFLSEARKNDRHFATVQEEAQSLIYNWAPVEGPSSHAYIFPSPMGFDIQPILV
eukprot:gnl/MRDRNA2_/MRDRNA2_21277_c0_seq1.p1 gnl/MRDRNA2_/MRDRNA2_21277_c0~~gnl/MRDRNA2_/MRDRNA2_21277_c0_seq1.p1  ORF type:complete len:346 (+),score=29.89 gnl/MRDRNA2_/MRDRNA2_21277_c0_seq1:112-1149(+)